MRARLAILCLCAALGACADMPRGTLHFGMEDAPEGKKIFWPPQPEVPRYFYAGQLTGEQNFKREGEDSGARGFLRWLAGIGSGDIPPTVLQRPLSGVVDARGRILVTDTSRQAVFVFDGADGKLEVWDRAEGLAAFRAPSGIALAPDGGVWVADAELGRVISLDANGNPRASFGRGELKRPTGIAWDAKHGLLWVADTYAHAIKAFDASGKLQRTLGRHGEAPGEFNYPTHLAFADGELYVADTMNARVQVFGNDGDTPVRMIGQRGLYVGNLVRPKGVSVDGEGNVYVVESYHDHLLVFNRKGEFLMPIGGVGKDTGKFYLPAGVWVDDKNRVFVADMFNGRVMVFQFLGGGAEGVN